MNKTIIIAILAVALIGGTVVYAVNRNTDPVSVEDNTPAPSNNSNPSPVPVVATPSAPVVTTDPTIIPTASTALVGGKVYPNGAVTSYWFEYGTTPDGASRTTVQVLGSGYANIPTPAYITGLKSNTKYYFRLVAENFFGKVMGTQYAFQTNLATPTIQGSAPVINSSAANSIDRTTATLNGSVHPKDSQATYWFEYGTSPDFGSTTAFQPFSGSSKKDVAVSVANLVAGTKYYFRLNAQNQYGTVNASTLSFTTKAPAKVEIQVPPINGTTPGSNW